MMLISQDIHDVVKVRAKRLNTTNSNALTIEIETDDGILQQSMYFGNTPRASGMAAELFYALGGRIDDVITGAGLPND